MEESESEELDCDWPQDSTNSNCDTLLLGDLHQEPPTINPVTVGGLTSSICMSHYYLSCRMFECCTESVDLGKKCLNMRYFHFVLAARNAVMRTELDESTELLLLFFLFI